MNVLAINGSLILATIIALCSALIFPWILKLKWQFDWEWFYFVLIVSLAVLVCSLGSYIIIRWQVVKVIEEHLRLMTGLPILERDRIGLGFWLVLILICFFIVTLIFYAWFISEFSF